MAVLAAFRFTNQQVSEVNVSVFFIPTPFPIGTIIDDTLLQWGLYVVFIIIGLSGDILPKYLCEPFKKAAHYCLLLSFYLYSLFIYGIGINVVSEISPDPLKPKVAFLGALTLFILLIILFLYLVYDFVKSITHKKTIPFENY